MGISNHGGYVYKLSGVPYEDEDGKCSILVEHTFLCFGDPDPSTYFLVENDSDKQYLTYEAIYNGGIVEQLTDLEVGYYEDDGTASFVVVKTFPDDSVIVTCIY